MASSGLEVCPDIDDENITVLFDNTSSKSKGVDFVFIHGLNGHPKNTWSHSTGFYWPWELRKHLNNSRAKTRPLVFIGHSMGGLVAKTAAVRAHEYLTARANNLDQLYSSIRGFVFFGVPHGGSSVLGLKRVWILQKMARAAFKEIPPKIEEALKSGSDELLDLADSFRLLSIYIEYKLVMASYVEGLSTVGLGERVVDAASAATDYSRAIPAETINADHVNMVKFESAKKSTFRNVAEQLEVIETDLLALNGNGGPWAQADLRHVYESLAFPEMTERYNRIKDPHEHTFEWIFSTDLSKRRPPVRADRLSLRPTLTGQDERLGSKSNLATPRSSFENRSSNVAGFNPFLTWLQNDDSPLFWISGKAASGKSTMMKHLDKHPKLSTILSNHYAASGRTLSIGSFFFWDQGKSTLQKSRDGLLRALLHHLLAKREDMWMDVFDEKCRQLFRPMTDAPKTMEERFSKPVVTWSWNELNNALNIFASRKPAELNIFLLIDGLDEFRDLGNPDDYLEYDEDDESEQAKRNVEAHRTIAKIFIQLSKRQGFKLCVSSRPVQPLEDAFDGYQRLRIHHYTQEDIRKYVDDRLGNHRAFLSLSKAQSERALGVIEALCSKADGVFLWVKLVANILLGALEAGDDIDKLEEKIQLIPPGLRGLFANMMAKVLPEYREEGLALFQRVLAARGLLTELTLSFSQESTANAIAQPSTRISEDLARQKEDQMARQLRSRCGGLLEIVANPTPAVMRASEDCETTWRELPWGRRPHIAIAPVVSFVHRTAIEYVQTQQLKVSLDKGTVVTTPYVQLLVCSLLRIKLIRMTMHAWEVFHALKDAVYYAKKIELETASTPFELLDAVEMAMYDLWTQSMSAGRPTDYDKDPGFGPVVEEMRDHKGVPSGSVTHGSSIWGPVYDAKSELDDMLSLAVQADLRLYLDHRVNESRHKIGILRPQGQRPLLAYAVDPRSLWSLKSYYPSSVAATTPVYAHPDTIQWLLDRGLDPNEQYRSSTVWRAALHNYLVRISLLPRSPDTTATEAFCANVREWAISMSLLVDNGANLQICTNGSEHEHCTALSYLWTYWVCCAPTSVHIQQLFTNVVQRTARDGMLPEKYATITPSTLLALDPEELRADLRILTSSDHSLDYSNGPNESEYLLVFKTYQKRMMQDFPTATNVEQTPNDAHQLAGSSELQIGSSINQVPGSVQPRQLPVLVIEATAHKSISSTSKSPPVSLRKRVKKFFRTR